MDEERWIESFDRNVKPRLRRALVALDDSIQRRRAGSFLSFSHEQSLPLSIKYVVGPIVARHEIKLTCIAGGRVKVSAGRVNAEYSIKELDQPKIDAIAREWLVEIGFL